MTKVTFPGKKFQAGVKKLFGFGFIRFFLWCCILQSYFEAGSTGSPKIAGYSTVLQHYLPFVRQNKASLLEIPQNGVAHLVTLWQL